MQAGSPLVRRSELDAPTRPVTYLSESDLPDYVFVCGLLETGSLSRSRIDYTLFVNGVSVYG